MKKTLVLLAIVTLFSFQKKPVRVIFFGDSITQAGAQPGGFITLINDSLKARGNANYELIGAGIGGNKVYDLFFRFEDDVFSKNPDEVVMWVGVNDVWHKRMFQTGTDPDKFVAFYAAMIKKLQSRSVKVILCTPASIGEKTDYSNDMDGELNRYSQFVRDLGAKYNCPVVDFRTLFHEYNLRNNTTNKDNGVLTQDGVHLNPLGNQIVARLLYKQVIN